MPITLHCSCGKSLQVDEQHRGKKTKCPACGSVLLVESAGDETAVQAEAPKPRPLPATHTHPPLKGAEQRSMTPWLIGGGCGLFALLICLTSTSIGGWLFYSSVQTEKVRVAEAEKADKERVRRDKQQQSQNNLKLIGLAMHTHHDFHKRFPPFATVNPQTQQMQLIWRVFLLPYLDEENMFRAIRLQEPWDSQHNRQFHDRMPKVYRLPGTTSNSTTHYQMFFGEGAMYSRLTGPQQLQPGVFAYFTRHRVHTIPDGSSNTILAVEAAQPINWMKPDDIPYAEGKLGSLVDSIGNHWGDDTFNAGMYDGSVRRFRRTIPPQTLQWLINPTDGNAVNIQQWDAGAP